MEKAPHRYGVIIGTGEGGAATRYVNTKKIVEDGMQATSPFFAMCIPSTASGFFAMEWNLQGPCFSVNSACATGNHALGVSASLIRMGMADVIFTGGAEAVINPTGLAAFGNIMALSERNDSPETASRPFDKDRDGFVLSEGAGVLCLEELEHAQRRGATIYAELSGYGFTSDAYDLVAPHPSSRGSARAMQDALDSARLTPDQIDLVNCHAASTSLGDLAESRAIGTVFKELATKVPAHSTKSMTGHPLGAASALEAIAVILAIQKGVIHPTINQFEQDPKISLNVVQASHGRPGSTTWCPTVSGSAVRTRPLPFPASPVSRGLPVPFPATSLVPGQTATIRRPRTIPPTDAPAAPAVQCSSCAKHRRKEMNTTREESQAIRDIQGDPRGTRPARASSGRVRAEHSSKTAADRQIAEIERTFTLRYEW